MTASDNLKTGVAYPHYTGGNVTHRRARRATEPVEQPDLSL
jgi:hypothetical protein